VGFICTRFISLNFYFITELKEKKNIEEVLLFKKKTKIVIWMLLFKTKAETFYFSIFLLKTTLDNFEISFSN